MAKQTLKQIYVKLISVVVTSDLTVFNSCDSLELSSFGVKLSTSLLLLLLRAATIVCNPLEILSARQKLAGKLLKQAPAAPFQPDI